MHKSKYKTGTAVIKYLNVMIDGCISLLKTHEMVTPFLLQRYHLGHINECA